ncbi:MAG: gluconate 2-dehydrogenase subunit 3 family protein [Acidimicrobiales bacterium]
MGRHARDPHGQTPGGEGRFRGYDVLAQDKYWDPATTEVVRDRLAVRAGLSFFTAGEAETAGALFDLLLAQHSEPRVPVLQLVDRRLSEKETDGWRYEELPEDSEAWRGSLAYLEEDSQEKFGARFHQCSRDQRGNLLQAVADADRWHDWPAQHVWSLWTRYVCSAFYSHPWAWNEVGFGGPAYPRGYKVLHRGWREPWEVPESDADDPVGWAERVEAAKRSHEVHLTHKQ